MNEQKQILVIGETRCDSYFSEVHGLSTIKGSDDRLFTQIEVSKAVFSEDFFVNIGGRGANIAINLSRMDLQVDLWSLLGRDMLGDSLLTRLDQENVNTEKIERLDEVKTAAAVHILNRSLGRQSSIKFRTNWQALPHFAKNFRTNHYDWVFVTSVGGNFQLLDQMFSQIKTYSTKIIFNPGEEELADRNKLIGLLDDVDILILNRSEAEQVVKGNNLDELAKNLSKFVKMVVITSTEDGSIVCDGRTVWRIGIYPSERRLDQNGVGDAFGAAFLAGIVQGKPISEALIFASANASQVISCIGATCQTLTTASGLKQLPVRESSL